MTGRTLSKFVALLPLVEPASTKFAHGFTKGIALRIAISALALAPCVGFTGNPLYSITDLGTLGGLDSRAYAINNHRQVVGFSAIAGQTQHAFVYTPGETMADLNSLIDTNAGWMLEVATAINDSGQIAGIGTHPAGQLRAFLLTPVLSLQITLALSNSIQLQFTGQANAGYVIEYRDSLSSGAWQVLVVLDPVPFVHEVLLTQPLDPTRPMRFYRVRDTTPTVLTSPTNRSGEYSPALVDATQQSNSSGLAAESSFHFGFSEVQRVGAVSALSAIQAGALAQALANERARTLYACQPFRTLSPARFVDGHWVWRDLRGQGPVDMEAEVEFGADGANAEVNVLLLDSRVVERFR